MGIAHKELARGCHHRRVIDRLEAKEDAFNYYEGKIKGGSRPNLEKYIRVRSFKSVQGRGYEEAVELIFREEAVCRFCFHPMKEEDNILKTKCRCPLTLMHAECANISWSATINICHVCKQHIQNIPVTISIKDLHQKSAPTEIKKNRNKVSTEIKNKSNELSVDLKLHKSITTEIEREELDSISISEIRNGRGFCSIL